MWRAPRAFKFVSQHACRSLTTVRQRQTKQCVGHIDHIDGSAVFAAPLTGGRRSMGRCWAICTRPGARFLDSGSWSRGVTVSALDSESSRTQDFACAMVSCGAFAACRVSHKACPAGFHSFATSLSEPCAGFLRTFPSQGFWRVSFGFKFRGFPASKSSLGFLQVSCKFSAGFLRVSCGFPAGFLRVSRRFLCFSFPKWVFAVRRGFPCVPTLVCSGFPRSFSWLVAGLTRSGFGGWASPPRSSAKVDRRDLATLSGQHRLV